MFIVVDTARKRGTVTVTSGSKGINVLNQVSQFLVGCCLYYEFSTPFSVSLVFPSLSFPNTAKCIS